MKWMALLTFILFQTVEGATILIDPGHGGVEYGANRTFDKKTGEIREKNVVLEISKYLKMELQKDHRVFLTRSVDRTVTLQERADMAEAVEADLFISVHANSSNSVKSSGFETYYLDNKKDAAVNKVELTENGSFEKENHLINHILVDLVIDRTVEDSSALAKSIHGEIGKSIPEKYNIKDRGIRSGLFYVLALSKRPGVLLEVGFLSNPKEIKKLLSPTFQKDYARKVAIGIKKFLKKKLTASRMF